MWIDIGTYTDYGEIHEASLYHMYSTGCAAQGVDEWDDYGYIYYTCGTCGDEI